MIRIDRKTCRDIQNLAKSYDENLFFSPDLGGYCHWHYSHPEKAEKAPSINLDEVPGSLSRLVDSGLIKKIQGSMNGGMIFRITPELRHYKAFWFDRFSKKFTVGFVSGILVGVCANLATPYIKEAIEKVYMLLLSL